jgi:hypothetical protein
MTSTTEQYSAAANQAGSAVEKIADFWTQGAQALSNRNYLSSALPQTDLVPVAERYFKFVQRTVDMNREFTLKWMEAATMLSSAIREQAESLSEFMSEQAESARDLVHEQVDTAEQVAREQAEKAEQAEKDLVRQARKAERDQAKQAHEKARERYEDLTKAELSDLAGKRDLPKTGTNDELIERLVEADSK